MPDKKSEIQEERRHNSKVLGQRTGKMGLPSAELRIHVGGAGVRRR